MGREGGKGADHQACWPKFESWNPHGRRRRLILSCPQISTCFMGHGQAYTYNKWMLKKKNHPNCLYKEKAEWSIFRDVGSAFLWSPCFPGKETASLSPPLSGRPPWSLPLPVAQPRSSTGHLLGKQHPPSMLSRKTSPFSEGTVFLRYGVAFALSLSLSFPFTSSDQFIKI